MALSLDNLVVSSSCVLLFLLSECPFSFLQKTNGIALATSLVSIKGIESISEPNTLRKQGYKKQEGQHLVVIKEGPD